MDSPLDNPAWHALRGPQAHLAESSEDGRALRFDPDVSVFTALDRQDEGAWASLAELVGPGGSSALFRAHVAPAPRGWQEVFRVPCFQMVAGELPAVPEVEITPLGAADAPQMQALVELTDPGPFRPRTVEMGRYLGVRRGGRLLAMAGERMHLPGFREVSAVCTHPDARGEGLAAALTARVVERIRAQGEQAFLHVTTTNVAAQRLYAALGFETRREQVVVGHLWQPPK